MTSELPKRLEYFKVRSKEEVKLHFVRLVRKALNAYHIEDKQEA